MPITRLCKAILRPLIKPAIWLSLAAGMGLITLNQLGITTRDIRAGQLMPALKDKVFDLACQMHGVCGLDGTAIGPDGTIDAASLSGMLEHADLSNPGAIQELLRANGSLRSDADGTKASKEADERGVVIFSPDGKPTTTRPDPADTETPASNKTKPIVRVHWRDPG